MQTLQLDFSIPPSHPSLPGHFPGRPVVPGVVLLAQVEHAMLGWLGGDWRMAALPQVKFLQPLLPGEAAVLQLDFDEPRLRFSVRRGGSVICSGTARLVREIS